jgi:hypothetical protein
MADELAAEFHEIEEHAMMGFNLNGESYAISSKRPNQELQILRHPNEQEALQRATRKHECIQEKEILRSNLHGKRHDSGGCDSSRTESQGDEVSQRTMRNMRDEDRLAYSPHRQQSIQQQPREFDDAMRVMPHKMALRTREEQQKDTEEVSLLRQASEKEGALQHSRNQDVPTRRSTHGSWWEIEPDVGRVANGVKNRKHRLKALGNGQVPIQAAVAWSVLMGRIAA